MISRRQCLATLGAGFPLLLAGGKSVTSGAKDPAARTRLPGEENPWSSADEQFLDELEQAGFRYFWETADPLTGLIKDRSDSFVRSADLPPTFCRCPNPRTGAQRL